MTLPDPQAFTAASKAKASIQRQGNCHSGAGGSMVPVFCACKSERNEVCTLPAGGCYLSIIIIK